MEIAQIIASQLGGLRRLNVMIGAKNAVNTGNGLSFKFKKSKKINYVKIELNGLDLYDIEFGNVAKYDYSVKEEFNNIYADQLKDLFEETT